MKKVIIALTALALPLFASAQSEGLLVRKQIKSTKADQSEYAKAGAVPEANGMVEWNEVIALPNKSKQDIYTKLASWASLRYEPNSGRGIYTDPDFFKNIEYSKVQNADKGSGKIVCQGAEELIFSIKPLSKNYTQAFYQLSLLISDNKVEMKIGNISFNVDQGEGRFERVAAEEWITDKEAINKKGKLSRISGKYRIKTIDLVDELKKEIQQAVMGE